MGLKFNELGPTASAFAGGVLTPAAVNSQERDALEAPAFGIENNFCLLFDGVNEYTEASISGGHALTLFTTAWSLSCWFKTTTSSLDVMVFMGQGANRWTGLEITGAGFCRLRAKTSSGSDPAFTSNVGGYNDGNWHHFVAGISVPNVSLFIDGVARGTFATLSGQMNDSGFEMDQIRIGRYHHTYGGYFDGRVDEVAVHSSAITTAAEALAMSNGGVIDLEEDSGDYTSSADLIHYVRLEDGSGNTATERVSGLDHTGYNMEAGDWSTDTKEVA